MAGPDGRVVDLLSPARDWRDVLIGGSTRTVRLERLHLDRANHATTSLVEFPAGWTRPDTGHYPCAEELLVVRGEITVSGVRYRAGDYGYLPPDVGRFDSSSPGMLALAWFSGVPTWVPGLSDRSTTHGSVSSTHAAASRPPREEVPGCAWVAPELGERDRKGVVELVSLTTWQWALVADDDPYPSLPGPVFCRSWT